MTPIVTFFSSRAGVGTTSLVYHLAWMYAEQGTRVLVADLDPQVSLTMDFLRLDEAANAWLREQRTLPAALDAACRGDDDAAIVGTIESIASRLFLLAGTAELVRFEDELAVAWALSPRGSPTGVRTLAAPWRVLRRAAAAVDADVVLVDVGPGLGSVNRAVMLASDHVVSVIQRDTLSMASLPWAGPWLRNTRSQWAASREAHASLDLPIGSVSPSGYVLTFAALPWPNVPIDSHIAAAYSRHVSNKPVSGQLHAAKDPHCLGTIADFRSLAAIAQEARKPMFMLGPADGALGSHAAAVQQAYADYEQLSARIAAATWRREAEPAAKK